MKRKIIVVSALALLVCPSFSMPAQANPITAPACRDVPSCIVTGTVVIGGVVYYLIENTVTGVVRRIPAKQVPPSHRSNEQYEEKLVGTSTKGKTCEEIAEDLGKETGKKWRVKNRRIIPYTGPLWQPPGNPVQIECILTTAPKEQ